MIVYIVASHSQNAQQLAALMGIHWTRCRWVSHHSFLGGATRRDVVFVVKDTLHQMDATHKKLVLRTVSEMRDTVGVQVCELSLDKLLGTDHG